MDRLADILKTYTDGNWRLVAVSSCVGATIATLACLVIYNRRIIPKSSRKMKLYHHKPLKSTRCAWLIHELKAEKDIEFVEHNPYEVLVNDKKQYDKYMETVHPNGRVPALQLPDGRVVKESGAICLLLAHHYRRLLPKQDWVSYYDWSIYAVGTVDVILGILHTQLFGHVPDRDVVSRAVTDFRQFASCLQNHMEGRTYICGKEFTAADVVVGFSLMWASTFKGGVLMADYPAVHDYLRRLKKRKAFALGMGSTNEWLEGLEDDRYDPVTYFKLKYLTE